MRKEIKIKSAGISSAQKAIKSIANSRKRVFITRYGKSIAVVLSISDFRLLRLSQLKERYRVSDKNYYPPGIVI